MQMVTSWYSLQYLVYNYNIVEYDCDGNDDSDDVDDENNDANYDYQDYT